MIALLNQIFRDWRGQCVAAFRWMGLPIAILVAAVAQPWVAFELLARDPLAVAESSADCCRFYFGALSNLGVLIWALGAGGALVAGAAFWRAAVIADSSKASPLRWAQFFFAAGLISLIMAGDDVFMLHERSVRLFEGAQVVVLASYAIMAAGFFLYFWREILAEAPLFLMLAGGLFALSFGLDLATDVFDRENAYVLEDGAKFLGVAAWSAYFTRRAIIALGAAFAARKH